ncbi:Gmad2 immunoglobulin-like domain-containing protein [Kribbella sp. NPDC051952]|uniref:Gmad2 immunoglobulin-like domain-containing protein n=1 Tax=Kribbella sp. NPDC051952 TaxID=3154851 RepID=UPI00342D601B
MNDNSNDPFDEIMRRALAEEADRVEPADALPEIRARAHAQRRSTARRPWLLTVGAAAVGTAAAIGAFTVFNGDQNTANDGDAVAGSGTTTTAAGSPSPATVRATPAPSPVASRPPTTQPEATKAPSTQRGKPESFVKNIVVPVYWLGDRAGKTTAGPKATAQTRSTVRLFRTWTRVSGRPAEQAIRIMTSKQPEDPDYYSVWRGAEVSSVTRSEGVVNVDFKALPASTLDADTADLATQQLIYTVQGALHNSTEPIQITQQGRPGGKLFGQVDTSTPLGRAQQSDVQAFVWIDSPADGQVTKGPVVVQGTANAFEATVNYQVTNLKTRTTTKGFTNTKGGQKFMPYLFQLKLTPGLYQIEAYLISEADGTISDADTKTIEVK